MILECHDEHPALPHPDGRGRHPAVLETGVPGLDHVLGGGLVHGMSVLIDGPPGSGKSTLGLRLLHEGIVRHGEPALMLAFEEFPRQVHQSALDAGVDLRAHEEAGRLRILWTSPQRILEALQGGSDLLERVMEQLGVRRVLVDSITHFRRVPAIASSEGAMRETLGSLLQQMKLRGVTTILVKELDSGSPRSVAFEEYLVDTSIRLHHAVAGIGSDREARCLEVRKARGLANVAGLHPFELGPGGPRVHVRWEPAAVDAALPARSIATSRIPARAPGLDEMLGGGYRAGTLVLIEGDAGSGRTTLALQSGGPGVLLREEPVAGSASVSIPPGPARFERAQSAMLSAVRGSDVVVFDGLADLPADERAEMASFLSRAARRSGALILATSDASPELRSIADCVVALRASFDGARTTRSLAVLKHRASAHALEARGIRLSGDGLSVVQAEP